MLFMGREALAISVKPFINKAMPNPEPSPETDSWG